MFLRLQCCDSCKVNASFWKSGCSKIKPKLVVGKPDFYFNWMFLQIYSPYVPLENEFSKLENNMILLICLEIVLLS